MENILQASVFLLVSAIVCLPPILFILVAWARWNGLENFGMIELCTADFYPHCRSRKGLIAIMSTLVSLGLFPFFLIAAFEDILYVYIYIAAVLAALFGMVMSLFSRPAFVEWCFLLPVCV